MSERKPFVFVLMPFDAAFDDVYRLGIKVACESAGALAERVDEQMFQESILDRIYAQIRGADIVVADMSGRSPNVFYETGYAHALNKPVVLLTRASEDIPFDLKHYPHIVYGGRIVDLLRPLEERIRKLISSGSTGQAQSPPRAGTTQRSPAGEPGQTTVERQARRTSSSPGRVITVDASGSGDCGAVSDAMAVVAPGDCIVIKPGVYYERIVINCHVEIEGDTSDGQVIIEGKTGPIVFSDAPFASVRNVNICNLGRNKLPAVAIGGGRLLMENCDISSLGGHCLAIQGGEPMIRRNRIHHGGEGGIAVFDGASAIITDNEIFENYLAGIFIFDRAAPIIRGNTIRDGKQSGIYVYDNGSGVIEDNEIVRNAHAGIATATGADPYVRGNTVRQSGHYGAVYVFDGGGGFFENNDLSGNRLGPWQVDPSCEASVTRIGNSPSDS